MARINIHHILTKAPILADIAEKVGRWEVDAEPPHWWKDMTAGLVVAAGCDAPGPAMAGHCISVVCAQMQEVAKTLESIKAGRCGGRSDAIQRVRSACEKRLEELAQQLSLWTAVLLIDPPKPIVNGRRRRRHV